MKKIIFILFGCVCLLFGGCIENTPPDYNPNSYSEDETENNGFTLDINNLLVVDGLSSDHKRIHFSNGVVLEKDGSHYYKESRSEKMVNFSRFDSKRDALMYMCMMENPPVDVYLPNIKIGDLVYVSASGESYRKVVKKEIAVDTVKVISFHDFHIAESASFDGNYTSKAWALLIGGKSKQSAELHGEYHGEDTKAIANIIFTNGKHVTLRIEDDPIWLDVTAGTKIRHYQVVGQNIYEPVFSNDEAPDNPPKPALEIAEKSNKSSATKVKESNEVSPAKTPKSAPSQKESAENTEKDIYIVKKISFHDLSEAEKASLDGSYSNNSWALLIGGKSSSSFGIHGNYKGKTANSIANVIFTNGKHTTIYVKDDPIWLEVEEGTKVRVTGENTYEPIF